MLAALGKLQIVHNTPRGDHSPKPAAGVLLTGRLAGAIAPVTLPIKDYPSDEVYRQRLEPLRAELDRLPGRRGAGALARGPGRRPAHRAATAPWGRNAARTPGYLTEVQALKLGDGPAIVTAPGELATQIGFEMTALSPAPETFVVGYANDGIGYLMPDEVHAEAGYEAGADPLRARRPRPPARRGVLPPSRPSPATPDLAIVAARGRRPRATLGRHRRPGARRRARGAETMPMHARAVRSRVPAGRLDEFAAVADASTRI